MALISPKKVDVSNENFGKRFGLNMRSYSKQEKQQQEQTESSDFDLKTIWFSITFHLAQ